MAFNLMGEVIGSKDFATTLIEIYFFTWGLLFIFRFIKEWKIYVGHAAMHFFAALNTAIVLFL